MSEGELQACGVLQQVPDMRRALPKMRVRYGPEKGRGPVRAGLNAGTSVTFLLST